MEMFGRNDIDNVARSVAGKTEDEVKAYHKIFWKRGKELPNYEKLLASIEKGEQRIQRKIDMQTALDDKMSRYRLPLIQLKFQYGNNKGKSFTEDEDRYDGTRIWKICNEHRIQDRFTKCARHQAITTGMCATWNSSFVTGSVPFSFKCFRPPTCSFMCVSGS